MTGYWSLDKHINGTNVLLVILVAVALIAVCGVATDIGNTMNYDKALVGQHTISVNEYIDSHYKFIGVSDGMLIFYGYTEYVYYSVCSSQIILEHGLWEVCLTDIQINSNCSITFIYSR